jgi:hypothetical protein
LLTTVDVHLVDGHTHWLEINFKVPLVGDALVYTDQAQKTLGYSLKEGVTALMVEQVSRPYRKKKTIRDNGLVKGKNDFSLPRWSK